MSTPRRARGSVVDPIDPRWKIQRAIVEGIDEVAARSGVSTSYLVELMYQNLHLDEAGLPVWLDECVTPKEVRVPAA